MASERDVKLVQAGIEAAAKAVSNRIEREEYGHAKAAVCLDLEAINALDPAAIVAEMDAQPQNTGVLQSCGYCRIFIDRQCPEHGDGALRTHKGGKVVEL